MLYKFFLSLGIAFLAVGSTYIDGERNLVLLADQAWNLFWSGFAAMAMSMIVAGAASTQTYVLEVKPSYLLGSLFGFFLVFIVIIFLGQHQDPQNPSYWFSGFRTSLGMIALFIGLAVSEGITLKVRDDV